jgi:protein gp37
VHFFAVDHYANNQSPFGSNFEERMATKSRIEWTEQTWNPVTGCTNVSPGCKHCYARIFAERLRAMGAPGYENGFDVTLQPNRLAEPLERTRSTIYFVNSMSDLFHEKIPFGYIEQVMDIIRQTPRHRYQILTKRPKQMLSFFEKRSPPANAWLGVSVENRKHGLPRLDLLRHVEATVRFLSIEPLLEELGQLDLSGINWVIVGGESGARARPMKPAWVRTLRDQCLAKSIPFFFKQWGAWGPDGERRSKKANGRLLDGQTWDGFPEPRMVRARAA